MLDSCRDSVGNLGNGLAGLSLTVGDPEGNELLEAGINLVVHGRILGADVAELLKETSVAVIVVPFSGLDVLTVVGSGLLEGLQWVCLGLGGAGSLHGLSTADTSDSALASSGFLFFGLVGGGGSIRGAGALRGSVVVDSPHVVKEIPAAGEAVSWDGTVTSFKEAKVGVISVSVESMGFALMTEQACIGREVKLSVHTARDPTAVRLQMGIQVLAAPGISLRNFRCIQSEIQLTGKHTSG